MRMTSRKPISLGGSKRVAALPPTAVDATRERLRHAVRDGEALVDAGTRRLADPFETLRNRHALDRTSAARNVLLWQAGDRFRRHWHGGHLDGLTAFDFSKESVDGGGGPQETTPTEAALRHRSLHHRASEAVGHRLMPYLDGVVIQGCPAAALCHLVADTAHARTAEALVIERLREALHRLVAHWGMDARHPAGRDHSSVQHLAGVENV